MWEENCGTAGNHSGRRAEVTCAALQWIPHRHLDRSNTCAVPELLRWQREPSATSYNHTAQALGQPNMKPAAPLRHYGLSSSEIPETGDEDDSIKTEPRTMVAARVSTEQGQWETIHPAQEVWKYHFDKSKMQQDRSYQEPCPSPMVILCSTTVR